MTTEETKIFEAEDGSLIETGDSDLKSALRKYFDSPVRGGRHALSGGTTKVGVLVEDATPAQVVSALEDIGYKLLNTVDKTDYKRISWIVE